MFEIEKNYIIFRRVYQCALVCRCTWHIYPIHLYPRFRRDRTIRQWPKSSRLGGEISGGNRRFRCRFVYFSNVLLLQQKAPSDKWALSHTWWRNPIMFRKDFPKIPVRNVQGHEIPQLCSPTIFISTQHLFWLGYWAIKTSRWHTPWSLAYNNSRNIWD